MSELRKTIRRRRRFKKMREENESRERESALSHWTDYQPDYFYELQPMLTKDPNLSNRELRAYGKSAPGFKSLQWRRGLSDR